MQGILGRREYIPTDLSSMFSTETYFPIFLSACELIFLEGWIIGGSE
jgi:hypothetical protein